MSSLAATIVKANNNHACLGCGSTEYIQAHHNIPGDDSTLVSICAECHSRMHPDVPRKLFFAKSQQPYWHNKSASSIAKELGVHPRTVVRAARKSGIEPGELTMWDEQLLISNIIRVGDEKEARVRAECIRKAENKRRIEEERAKAYQAKVVVQNLKREEEAVRLVKRLDAVKREAKRRGEVKEVFCPYCRSLKPMWKAGRRHHIKGHKKQQYKCQNCHRQTVRPLGDKG